MQKEAKIAKEDYKAEYKFEDFFAKVNKDYQNFVLKIHDLLVQDNYRVKVESKTSGFSASFSHPKTKRIVLNFLFRKKANFFMRIYADNFNKYQKLLDSLPGEMEKEISKAVLCKRFVNPEECNPRCQKGYDFKIRDNHYQKCRYSCFQFEVTHNSIPALADFIENERRERQV